MTGLRFDLNWFDKSVSAFATIGATGAAERRPTHCQRPPLWIPAVKLPAPWTNLTARRGITCTSPIRRNHHKRPVLAPAEASVTPTTAPGPPPAKGPGTTAKSSLMISTLRTRNPKRNAIIITTTINTVSAAILAVTGEQLWNSPVRMIMSLKWWNVSSECIVYGPLKLISGFLLILYYSSGFLWWYFFFNSLSLCNVFEFLRL